MKLFILRHGQAESFAASDAARKLTDQGREEVRAVVRKNSEVLADLEHIWVSPLVRAQQTADVVIEEIGQRPRKTCELLLPESTPAEIVEMLSSQPEGAYLLVSHQPLVGELVNKLCGRPNGFYPMGTGALAHLDLNVPAFGCGELVWLG
ncbi:phosphohistidine phosphatase SixA [Proteobacteria bacterium 005FR1]|nr:phosphohistidine phosphatase SixA [Proteobacteria bacterium 005FR1]